MGFNMEESADTMDTLAGIAMRGATPRDPRALVGTEPPVLPDIRLPGPQAGDAAAFVPRPAHSAERLAEELREVREKMAPFLCDLSPSLPEMRRTIAVVEADWRLEPSEGWTSVRLPHYGGPIGRARAWYRMAVELDEDHLKTGSLWVCFGGVDYKAAVFFNGELVGTHEGFFSPFECEITRFAHLGQNELLVRVDNDAICMGNNPWDDPRCGDKIYAATGLGWDEPGLGWHHCPPGMGIHRPVRIETRAAVHIHDIFVRPLHDEAEVRVEVFNCGETPRTVKLSLEIYAQNFACEPVKIENDPPPSDAGLTRFVVRVPMPGARLWSPQTPWLYRARVFLNCEGVEDAESTQFGMRTFTLDESPDADGMRGRFLLNGDPIRLRGANTMGNEQQCVLRGDFDQLRDDILLAKLANMNFLRFTQRPVEPEVYDLCDRLGMMAQTDLPLFAYLRRNQFCEAVRQSAEMERLVRRHPSNVLVSFINEPFPAAWGDKSHRHLTRDELESFFEAAARAVHLENPDRQIKPIDGDYAPPGPGLPDNHCYAGWYNGHGLDLGRLHRGFWIPVKPGWNYACGEFGAEGLDFEDVMREEYPSAWLPGEEATETSWTPVRIHKAQTGGIHYLWLEPGASMSEWIRLSQAHQEWVTRLMTEAFRRNNQMVSFAIHLFIDAWPAGWMKSIVDFRRHPKPAYFAYREALAPLATSLRLDRTTYFGGERVEAEVWLANDTNAALSELQLAYQINTATGVVLSGRSPARTKPCEAIFQGRVAFKLPVVTSRTVVALQLGLLEPNSKVVHDTSVELTIFPQEPPRTPYGLVLGGEKASRLAVDIGLREGTSLLIVDDPAHLPQVHEAVRAGASALLIEFQVGEFMIAGSKIRIEEVGMEPRHFVARDRSHPIMRDFQENDFRFWFDPALDRPSPLLHTVFFADDSWTPILHTGQGGWGRSWEPALAVAEKPFGKGRFIICQITLAGRLANPVAKRFLAKLIDPSVRALEGIGRDVEPVY